MRLAATKYLRREVEHSCLAAARVGCTDGGKQPLGKGGAAAVVGELHGHLFGEEYIVRVEAEAREPVLVQVGKGGSHVGYHVH